MPLLSKKGRRKRPMTAYNFFFAEEHDRIRKELQLKADAEADLKEQEELEKAKAEGRPPPRKKRRKKISPREILGFDNLGKLIGQRWKDLDDKDKEKYKAMARDDAIKYKQEFEENYKASVSSMLKQPGGGDRNRSDPSPLSGTETSASSSLQGYSSGPYGYMPSTSSVFNPMTGVGMPMNGISTGMVGINGMEMGSFAPLTPEQQILMQQNYMYQQAYGYPAPLAPGSTTSTNMQAMPPLRGSSEDMAGLSPSGSPQVFSADMQHFQMQKQLQQQAPPLMMTEHERQLAEAEKMRELLIQQGAAVYDVVRFRTADGYYTSAVTAPNNKASSVTTDTNTEATTETSWKRKRDETNETNENETKTVTDGVNV